MLREALKAAQPHKLRAFKNLLRNALFAPKLVFGDYKTIHFILSRRKDLSVFFDPTFYSIRYMNGKAGSWEAIYHFTRKGWKDMHDPNPFTHLRFVRAYYTDQSKDIASLTTLLGSRLYLNALLACQCTYQEIANASDTDDDETLRRLLVFEPQSYKARQADLVNIGHVGTIRHLFESGLSESRLSESCAFRHFNIPFDNRSSDYTNLSALTSPLGDSRHSFISLPKSSRLDHQGIDPSLNRIQLDGITIGIVLYRNTREEVDRVIGSIVENMKDTTSEIRLMVYDNSPGNTDYGFDRSVIYSVLNDKSNPGFGYGHNSLMSRAFSSGSDIYIGLNPDGFLLPSILHRVLEFIRSKPSGILLELNSFPLPHPKWFDPHTGETDWASGAAFAIDRLGYSKTKGFDPLFPMYCEDVDLSFRFRVSGLGVFVTPFSAFFHDIVPRRYQIDDPRVIRSMIGEWCLCTKWGISGRAERIRKEIIERDNSVILPKIKPFGGKTPDCIRDLFSYERFARSLFW